MKLARIATLILGLTLTACAALGPKNPQQAAFTLKTDYALALEAADAYGRLPFCDSPADPKICANRDVVKNIKVAKDVAKPAIDAAETAVRNPQFDKSATDAVLVGAQQALIALTKITAALPKAQP